MVILERGVMPRFRSIKKAGKWGRGALRFLDAPTLKEEAPGGFRRFDRTTLNR